MQHSESVLDVAVIVDAHRADLEDFGVTSACCPQHAPTSGVITYFFRIEWSPATLSSCHILLEHDECIVSATWWHMQSDLLAGCSMLRICFLLKAEYLGQSGNTFIVEAYHHHLLT